MALLEKGQGRLFKAYEASKRRYEAEHDRLMEHIRKYGYEKPMHKNVAQAPVVVAREHEIHEAPILPVRGRMNAPRRAVVPEGPPAPPPPRDVPDAVMKVSRSMKAKQKKAIREQYGVDVKGANKLYKEGTRVEIPKKETSSKRVIKIAHGESEGGGGGGGGGGGAEAPPKRVIKIKESGREVAPAKPKSNVPTANAGTMAGHPKKQSVMGMMWEIKRANPTMSKKEAMAQAWTKIREE